MNTIINSSVKFIANIALVLSLSACASMRIDVDIYKGPLADQEKVQDEQLRSLTVTSKRILEDLQRSLLRELKNGHSHPLEDHNLSTYQGSTAQWVTGLSAIDIAKEKSCTTMLTSKVINNKNFYAKASLACSLTELSSLFDDLAPPELISYYLNINDNLNELKGIKELKTKDKKTENVWGKTNNSIRLINHNIIMDSLRYLNWLQVTNSDLLRKYGIDKDEFIDATASLIAELANPQVLAKSLSSSFMENKKYLSNLTIALGPELSPSTFDYENGNDKIKNALSDNNLLANELLQYLDGIDIGGSHTDKSTQSRISRTGIARGLSILEGDDCKKEENNRTYNGSDKAKCDKKFDKSLAEDLCKLEGLFETLGKALNKTDILNQNREQDGLFTLMVLVDKSDEGNRAQRQKMLEKMLINYASKLLVLADKQALLANDLNGKAQKSSQKYVQVLQAIGSGIIVQINELQRRRTHTDDNNLWKEFDWALLQQQYGADFVTFKERVLVSLQLDNDKNIANNEILKAFKSQLDEWNKNQQKTLNNYQKRDALLSAKISSLDKAIKAFSEDVSTLIHNAKSDTKISRTNYVAQYAGALKKVRDRIERALGDSNCQYRALGDKTGQCSQYQDIIYILDNHSTFVITPMQDKSFSQHSAEFVAQLETLRTNIVTNQTKVKTEIATLQTKKTALVATVDAITVEKLDSIEKINAQITSLTSTITLYELALKHINAQTKTPGQDESVQKWIKQFSEVKPVNAPLSDIISDKARAASTHYVEGLFSCKKQAESEKHYCNSKKALDAMTRHLENLAIYYKTIYASDHDTVQHLNAALTSAYDLAARRQYIVPAVSYLRSSYPASSLQSESGAENWENHLFKSALKAIPIVGEYWANSKESKVQQQIDKQFWQNINTVRISGGGKTNYVVVKDDIGNWYVKSYSSDPKKIYDTLSNALIFNAAGKASSFLNTGEGALGLKNSSNVLDTMYGRHFETYTKETKAQFDEQKQWLAQSKWKTPIENLCSLDLAKVAENKSLLQKIKEQSDTFEATKKAFSKVKDDDTPEQASMILLLIKQTAAYSNSLVGDFKDKQCSDNDIAESIHSKIYKEFVEKQQSKRKATVDKFEQKVLFISEAIPKPEQPKLNIK